MIGERREAAGPALTRTGKRVPILLGLSLAIGYPLLRRWLLIPFDDLGRQQSWTLQIAFAWVVTFMLVAAVLLWERNSFASLGIRALTKKDLIGALVAFVLGGMIISATIPLVEALGLSSVQDGVEIIGTFSVAFRLVVALTAGITEEVIYRGYIVERINMLTGNLRVSTAISYLLFIAVHLSFWGIGGMLQIGIGSIVLYGLYLWRRNLISCILMHCANDIVAFVVIPQLLN